MEWTDDGLVIGVRLHGETSVIADLLTRAHGRHAGYVHGGRSRRLRPVLQPGNGVVATWRARTEDGLGRLTLEAIAMRAARLMGSAACLQGTNLLCALLQLLPEREPHPHLYDVVADLLDRLDSAAAAAAIVRLELRLLGELGFGLDLGRCAVTGETDDLAYVSPRTGRAVSRAAGEPYRDRILPLPRFLIDDAEANRTDILDGFRLTGYFLQRDLFAPRGLKLPASRDAYLRAISQPVRSSDDPHAAETRRAASKHAQRPASFGTPATRAPQDEERG